MGGGGGYVARQVHVTVSRFYHLMELNSLWISTSKVTSFVDIYIKRIIIIILEIKLIYVFKKK